MSNTAYADDIDSYCDNHLSTAEAYLEVTCQSSPIINHTIDEYGDVALKDYLKVLQPNRHDSYQERDDLIGIVYRYTKEILGDAIASRTARDLSENPIVLTANHHGIDYFSHSFQGSLLCSMAKKLQANSLNTVPVFSCANIPLDNATYPQGMLFYLVKAEQLKDVPKKLPVFPNRLRRQLVSSAPSFDKDMINRAKKHLTKMVGDGQISSVLKDTTDTILSEDYCSPYVMDQASYSKQAVLVNNLIWKRLFRNENQRTEVVPLELEKIVGKILQFDLKNRNSLIWKIMFDPTLRKTVLDELDGSGACWNIGRLKKRMHMSQLNDSDKRKVNGCGTVFFWGINDAGRRVPLHLVSSGGKNAIFIGIDDHNNSWELAYTPEAILTALNEGRLLPSLLTCFTVLTFARGVKCIGSYFQAEYLPNMQKGLVNALRQVPEYDEIASYVEKVDANFYLSGMLAVMTLLEDDMLVPAGPLEIISKGGITADDIEKILSIKVRDAHFASLLETLPDFVPSMLKTTDWKYRLTKDSLRLLEGKVVIK
ncbi:MAG: hypothetical protein ACQ9MH_21290 [Nitrospinales bacterium]